MKNSILKSSKFQQRSPREGSSSGFQSAPAAAHGLFVRLKFGATLVLGGWCLVLLLCPNAHAQSYSIDWHTIDGGGGTSTGGVYSVSGTIGQPDAGTLSGGSYSLVGGFWGVVVAIQTPGAPLLSVERLAGSVRVFWPLPATGFVLNQTAALTSPPAAIIWSPVPFTYSTNATHISLTVPSPTGHKYYRLRKP